MGNEHGHPSDQDLLRLADGELDAETAARLGRHLAACWTCRTRSHEIDGTIAAFVQAHHDRLDGDLPPADGPRALLRARMAELAASDAPPAGAGLHGLVRRFTNFIARRLTLARATVLLLAVALPFAGSFHSSQSPMVELSAHASPDAALTPGLTVRHTPDAICAGEGDDHRPDVPHGTALEIFRRYGIADPAPYAYELDYLIAPELGGATDIRNIWPQPYSGAWNAHLKDALEDHLRQLVCSRQLDLTVAQRDIAADWIGAYKKYFRTDVPLSAHAAFLKDRPWPWP